tara:strand:+ start:2589 stop:4385 length:1797 start_codon:yes stop_codon:yes gene_type:complete
MPKKNLKKIIPTQKLTNARYGKHKIVQLSYPKGHYSRSDMEKLITIQQEKYKGTDLIMMPSILLKRNYRSTKSFSVNDQVKIDLYGAESDYADHFVVYVWKAKQTAGGTDERNDCLYLAVMKSINKTELKSNWDKAYKWKKRLNLAREDKIDISHMPTIEDGLNININVTGDYTYTSPHTRAKTANVTLVDGHYAYTCKKSNELIKSISHRKQKLIYACVKIDDVRIYDGEKLQKCTLEKYYESKANLFGEYIVMKVHNEETLIKEYDEYYKNVEHIKKESNGLIDYLACGGSHKNAVLKLFYNMSRGIADPEPLTELENAWIVDTMKGALIFGTKCELDNATCYDMNSAYGSAMRNTGFKIPTKKGEFKSIDVLTDILCFGIYRCVVTPSKNNDIDKLFRFNSCNKYTHIDLYVARKLGLHIDLIIDEQANCLLYGPGTCVNAAKMFRTTIDYLYDLKAKKVIFAKRMLTALWGGLCQKNVTYKHAYNPDNILEIPSDCHIINMYPNAKGDVIEYCKNGQHYKYNYARFGVFLTAFVRKQMAFTIYPHREYVHRCHTDSILSSKPITELKISPVIGEWKVEKEGSCTIVNSIEVNWK